jgi:hypothetical protein
MRPHISGTFYLATKHLPKRKSPTKRAFEFIELVRAGFDGQVLARWHGSPHIEHFWEPGRQYEAMTHNKPGWTVGM